MLRPKRGVQVAGVQIASTSGIRAGLLQTSVAARTLQRVPSVSDMIWQHRV